MAGTPPSILSIRDSTSRFSGIKALQDVSFDAVEGPITRLIGLNGAGKTMCFNCVTALDRAASGQIFFQGEDLLRCPPHEVVRCGIARTFHNLELFTTVSVLENVLVDTVLAPPARHIGRRPAAAPAGTRNWCSITSRDARGPGCSITRC